MNAAKRNMKHFLLIGQSNMAGRGALGAGPALHHPNVQMFRNGEWLPAVDPLHTDKPECAGVGLGMSFAITLAEQQPDQVIGLLPCAVGGTPLQRWMPDGDLYANAVAIACTAGVCGALHGILWHQGEADSQQDENAASYGRRLSKMISALRAALDAANVPFVAGELGEFLASHETCRAHFRAVNAQMHALCGRLPNYGCVSASGLTDKGDHVHFDTASLREFGRRYARVYLELHEK